jgi:hypothetical protein
MSRRYVYLRLVDKTDDPSAESERLERVQRTIEKLGSVEWKEPPSLHGRGGYIACFTIPEPPDYEALLSLVDREGYMAVI